MLSLQGFIQRELFDFPKHEEVPHTCTATKVHRVLQQHHTQQNKNHQAAGGFFILLEDRSFTPEFISIELCRAPEWKVLNIVFVSVYPKCTYIALESVGKQ